MNQKEKSAGSNTITVRSNGPLVCEGNFTLHSADSEILSEESELFLCRCGKSGTAPYCDGSHKRIGFEDAAVFSDERDEELGAAIGSVTITCRTNAMYLVNGPVIIRSKDGSSVTHRNKAAMCRCGASANKPFCDASHKHCGFVAE